MSEQDPKRVVDGFLSLEGGVVSDRAANLLAKNQVAWLRNMTTRGAFARPRPAFHKIKTISEIPIGRYQHSAFFSGPTRPQLMVVKDGHTYSISTDTFAVTEVTPASGPNVDYKRLGWSVTAEKWWIYQDDDSKALIYDGSTSRRAEPGKFEVPSGNVIEYAAGRLAVALRDGQHFRIGDLVLGPSGTPQNGYLDSVLKFTETNFANEGGDLIVKTFGGPSNAGRITSMRQSVNLNTALGQGPLIVGTDNTMFSVILPFDRTNWKDINSVLQAVIMVGRGSMGQDSTQAINGDIWYRGSDGWRSLFMSVRNFGQWGNSVQSMEVERGWKDDPKWLLQFESLVQFNNRMLLTCRPIITEYGIYHQGLLTLDFNLLSSLNGKSPPVWDGIWDGPKILKLVFGVVDRIERCFMFVLNDDNRLELWEVLNDDAASNDDGTSISMSLEGARYAFSQANQYGIAPPNNFTAKRLYGAQLFLDQVEGTVNGELQYREDGNAPWRSWGSFSVCATDCSAPGDCSAPSNLQRQTRVKVRFPTPPELIDPSNNKYTMVGFDFQPKLDISGYARVSGFRLLAYEEQEFPYWEEESSDCVSITACNPS